MSYIEDLRKLYLDQPHEVSLETQALCNAACTFCPYPTLERQLLSRKALDDTSPCNRCSY